jgi:hypothetical protein
MYGTATGCPAFPLFAADGGLGVGCLIDNTRFAAVPFADNPLGDFLVGSVRYPVDLFGFARLDADGVFHVVTGSDRNLVEGSIGYALVDWVDVVGAGESECGFDGLFSNLEIVDAANDGLGSPCAVINAESHATRSNKAGGD